MKKHNMDMHIQSKKINLFFPSDRSALGSICSHTFSGSWNLTLMKRQTCCMPVGVRESKDAKHEDGGLFEQHILHADLTSVRTFQKG